MKVDICVKPDLYTDAWLATPDLCKRIEGDTEPPEVKDIVVDIDVLAIGGE